MAQVVFDTLTPLNGGLPGTAPEVFSATTDELAAALIAAGSMTDLMVKGIVKHRDMLFINANQAAVDANGYPNYSAYTSGLYRVAATFAASGVGVPPVLTTATLVLVI